MVMRGCARRGQPSGHQQRLGEPVACFAGTPVRASSSHSGIPTLVTPGVTDLFDDRGKGREVSLSYRTGLRRQGRASRSADVPQARTTKRWTEGTSKTGQAAAEQERRCDVQPPATLPRWGSRVRIPSPAPTSTQLTAGTPSAFNSATSRSVGAQWENDDCCGPDSRAVVLSANCCHTCCVACRLNRSRFARAMTQA
jgi:hypothetical protein